MMKHTHTWKFEPGLILIEESIKIVKQTFCLLRFAQTCLGLAVANVIHPVKQKI